jgi:hypothetical protein
LIVLQTLYRGTKHTFQSLKLLRYLAHTFASLFSYCGDNFSEDERIEAIAVVESYKFCFDKKIQNAISEQRKQMKERRRRSINGQSGVNGVAGVNGVITTDAHHDMEEAAESENVVIRVVDGETLADVIGVLITGARICLMNFEDTDDVSIEFGKYVTVLCSSNPSFVLIYS